MKLEELVNSLAFGGQDKIISQNSSYVVTKPLNSWDTNYRLYDIEESMLYLIDFEDVQNNKSDLEEHVGILFSDLLELNVEEIKGISWKEEHKG